MVSAIGPTKRPATTPFAIYVSKTAGFATGDVLLFLEIVYKGVPRTCIGGKGSI